MFICGIQNKIHESRTKTKDLRYRTQEPRQIIKNKKMNVALALEYIPRRMKELGFNSEYYIRFRHFVLQANEQLEINAFNQFFILVEEKCDVSIQSEFGVYDIAEDKINEQSYEHQGDILINNNRNSINHVRFIQVIPKHQPIKTNN